MHSDQAFGMAHFIAQADAVGLALFVVLLGMSVVSWTIILRKARQTFQWHQSFKAVEEKFHKGGFGSGVEQLADMAGVHPAVGRLLKHGLHAPASLRDAALAHAIDDEAARMESGQTCLASVASSAPFIGLFGTVWGIYHALVAIAASGQSSLDQVAGPVGEALIMTALGLAVAIPAALAYNTYQRMLRTQLARLERLAHEFSLRMAVYPVLQGQ